MRRPALALVAITLVAYLPVLRAGFIWDDDSYVEHNATLNSLAGLWQIWADPAATPQYYPLVHTTFWVEAHVWGTTSAVPFHVLNVLLHVTSAVLAWRLLRRLDVPMAWVAAALWAVHPVMVESVAWVTERKNVLSAVFYLLSLSAYLKVQPSRPLRYAEEPGSPASDPGLRRTSDPAWGSYGVAFWWFLLALLSKTVTATLPAAVLVILWWRRGRLTWRDVWPLVPFFVVGAIAGLHTGHLERTQVGAHGPEFAFSVADRVLIAGRAVWFYAAKLAVPWPLSFVYPRWTIGAAWQWAFPVGVVGVIAALWVLRRRLGRGPLAAALLFAGTLFPALGFADVYPMRYSFVADHFQYLASLALIVPTATLFRRRPRWAAVPVVACVAVTFARCLDYRDRVTLWTDTVAKNPTSWMAHTNLGHALADDPAAAWREYRAAADLAPHLPEPHLNLAIGYARSGDAAAAIAECRLALAVDPVYPPALANLAKLYVQSGDLPAAVAAGRDAVAAAPGYAPAHAALGRALDRSGQPSAATDAYARAVALSPADADLRVRLAEVDARLGRPSAAVEQYQAAVSIDPGNGGAWSALAPLLVRAGRPADAAECLRRAAAASR